LAYLLANTLPWPFAVAIDTARISVALVTELALVASLANTFIWVPALQEIKH
jgi:hypothetical protein